MHAKLTSAISKLGFGALLITAVFAAQAYTPAAVAGDKDAALVKYLGTQDDMILFNVAYKNPTGSSFSVIIKDQDENQLYQSIFKDTSFYKQFRLPREDRNKITFVIRKAGEDDIIKTFQINVNSHFIEDVAVKKLN